MIEYSRASYLIHLLLHKIVYTLSLDTILKNHLFQYIMLFIKKYLICNKIIMLLIFIEVVNFVCSYVTLLPNICNIKS